jgi:mannose-6-phosphate isomerase class I
MDTFRRTSQHLLPVQYTPGPPGQYDIYPSFPLPAGTIQAGYAALAQALSGQTFVIIDGYGGILWEDFRHRLDAALRDLGHVATWRDVVAAHLPPEVLEARLAPFIGQDDPLFGTRFTGILADFFDADALRQMSRPAAGATLTIVYGCGAALVASSGCLVYVDLPKNEIQFRARAGSITNLGASTPATPQQMYRRCYFVDWVALNRHKAALLPRVDLIVDGQRPPAPLLMTGAALRTALTQISQNYFRVRPWFEPGVWGGQWLKQHLPQLATDVPNYAWSFELIVPENGLIFSSDGYLLEVSFDWLMYHDHRAILGHAAERFGTEFPIRFDFLDTFAGGNLSVQCHPRPEYIRQHFGENFTQDETYYILQSGPAARVYLGFQPDVDPAAFRADLERSYQQATPLDVERYVQSLPARQHDLFLIPNGTIHCSGMNTLVLEISATPYIFTFKMYDWMRLDLNGQPRPLNIARAFENLYFDRQGERIPREFVAQPVIVAQGSDWQIVHLPTHEVHFYDVQRLEFATHLDITTDGSVHILSLVEGQALTLETAAGLCRRFHYAETFVVPAAAGHYRLTNESAQPIKVIKAFIKP